MPGPYETTYTYKGGMLTMDPCIKIIEGPGLRYECTISKEKRTTALRVFDKCDGRYDPLEVTVTCSEQDTFDAGVGILIAIGKWHIVEEDLRLLGEQALSWRDFKEWARDDTLGLASTFTLKIQFSSNVEQVMDAVKACLPKLTEVPKA